MRQVKAFCILILSILAATSSCKNKEQARTVSRSFYYWKSSFALSPLETKTLSNLEVNQLYVKFFDVVWDNVSEQPNPVAPIRFSTPPPANTSITPVVFITNETLTYLADSAVESFGLNLVKLMESLATTGGVNLSNEIQIDCDWTAGTKEMYFQLLKVLKAHPYMKGKTLSATIRLHQVKYRGETGVPPVDKGLLMCYNMGNLRSPKTKNSIIETDELSYYISSLRAYPLTLDIALPLFDWGVLFHGNNYKGLIRNYGLKGIEKDKERIIFERDTVLNGTVYKKGDWIRYEDSDATEVTKAAEMLRKALPYKNHHVILYHLDEPNLIKYRTNELETIYNSFH